MVSLGFLVAKWSAFREGSFKELKFFHREPRQHPVSVPSLASSLSNQSCHQERVQQPRLCTPPGGWAELLPTTLGFLWVLGRAAVFLPHNILPQAQHSASLVPVLGWGWGWSSGLSQRKQSVFLHSPLTLASSSFLIREPQAQIK